MKKQCIVVLGILFTAQAINSKQTWKAGSSKFTNYTIEQLQQMNNLQHLPKDQYFYHKTRLVLGSTLNDEPLPKSFSWRDKAPQCMVPRLDQGDCGSCYSYATSGMLAERLCINSNSDQAVPLAPAYIMTCDPFAYGCNGGVISQVLDFLEEESIITNECIGYKNETLDKCPKKCVDGLTPNYRVRCQKGSKHQFLTEDEIKRELMKNGPVASSMVIYSDLLTYESGIYFHDEGSIIGGHAILLVGWGEDEEDGEKYWEVQNSWGQDWGEDGFFRIRLGDSEIATELFGGGFTCIPEIDNSKYLEFLL